VWAAATAGGHLTAGAAAPKADDAKERARAAAAETARRAAEARERARAERARLIAALAEAKTKVEELTRKRDEQKSALTATEAELERVKARAINLQSEVSALTDEE
jgi:chromosome segregation ATPase